MQMARFLSHGRGGKPPTLRLAGAVIAAVALAVSACSSNSSTASSAGSGGTAVSSGGKCSGLPSGPIKIGDILSLSNSGGAYATELGYAKTTIAYFNAHDSICGHKVVLDSVDDKSDPATGLSLARQLIASGVTIFLDDSNGAVQDVVHPYLMQQHAFVAAGHPSYNLNNAVKNPTDFNYEPSTAQDAQAEVGWAKSHHLNNIGVLSDGLSLSEELAGYVKTDAAKAGLKYIEKITYSGTALDDTTPLTKAKEAGVQTLLLAGYTGIPHLVAGIQQIGFKAPILSPHFLYYYGITPAQVPAGTVDECWPHFTKGAPTSDVLTPAATDMLDHMVANFGPLSPATSGVLPYYSGLLIIKHAIEESGSTDGLKMASATETTTSLPTVMPGISLSFSKADHSGFPTSAITMCTLATGKYDILTAAAS
jgi:ABC-type branched-subunit amino acid transport system substrate-binding protein